MLAKIRDSGLKFGRLSELDEVKSVVLHHSAVDKPHDVYSIHNYHKGLGWAGCGYHYFIAVDGTVWTGRPPWAAGAHAYGYNGETIGICLAGDFSSAWPTDDQLIGLILLLHGVLSNAWLDVSAIVGHRELDGEGGDTECPGTLLKFGPFIREKVAELLRSPECQKLAGIDSAADALGAEVSDLNWLRIFIDQTEDDLQEWKKKIKA